MYFNLSLNSFLSTYIYLSIYLSIYLNPYISIYLSMPFNHSIIYLFFNLLYGYLSKSIIHLLPFISFNLSIYVYIYKRTYLYILIYLFLLIFLSISIYLCLQIFTYYISIFIGCHNQIFFFFIVYV